MLMVQQQWALVNAVISLIDGNYDGLESCYHPTIVIRVVIFRGWLGGRLFADRQTDSCREGARAKRKITHETY